MHAMTFEMDAALLDSFDDDVIPYVQPLGWEFVPVGAKLGGLSTFSAVPNASAR